MIRPPPTSPLFPSPPLFRSERAPPSSSPLAGRTLSPPKEARIREPGVTTERLSSGDRTDRPAWGEQRVSKGNEDVIRSRSEEHTSELQSLAYLVCRLLLEKK